VFQETADKSENDHCRNYYCYHILIPHRRTSADNWRWL